jgi:myo-inositol 2-dehydrogenase / D-chiro-inositol 1-dehydrogenase
VILKVGVIGTGMIGTDHIRRLTTVLSGASVIAVNDVDADRAKEVADALPGAVRVHADGVDLINDDNVDAVLVCSWGPTHEDFVLASIAAEKPVFCEKPLATTPEACLRILEAEVRSGHRLVQVGYMRRYDASYRALKAAVDDGVIGAPLMMHCTHRNPSVPSYYASDSAITDTAVHEIDMVRWLFGEEIVATSILTPRRSRHGGDLADPTILLLEMESGIIVDVEVSVNIRYGYDIRGEVVGEDGTAALGEMSPVTLRVNGSLVNQIPAGWRERFLRAYDTELQEWIDAVRSGGPVGPSSWDGYAAAAVSDAALQARRTGARVVIDLADRPALYSAAGRTGHGEAER